MTLPLGKLPPQLLAQMLTAAPVSDARVLLKPGIGLDCAVVDMGDRYLVFKSDPITFATDEIGWYLVQINSNDIATTGGVPRWLMVTMLLPEGQTTAKLVEQISDQLYAACREKGISVIGGHTEITYGIDRPILSATMIGEVAKSELITPEGATAGDKILLTKGIPIEATALLAREFPERLAGVLNSAELRRAQDYLYTPGISVLRDAQIASGAGNVTAMHDPTEGGLAGALWELCAASGQTLHVNRAAIPIPDIAQRICQTFALDPLATIASGALLLTASSSDVADICNALAAADILCVEIGTVGAAGDAVYLDGARMIRPQRDEITRVYETAETL